MAKIYPQSTPPSSSSSLMSLRREVFTIWMKSLVLNGNGCTVYNSARQVAYRVDNYDSKYSKQVYLMDQSGKTLYKILQKGFDALVRRQKRRLNVLESKRLVEFYREGNTTRLESQWEPLVTRLKRMSEYKIMDTDRGPVAEVRRKQTDSGLRWKTTF